VGDPATPAEPQLFSRDRMPPSGQAPGETRWLDTDSAKDFESNPHPLLGIEDVTYRINSLGYRCPEFATPKSEAGLTLITLGASEVFGCGVPEEKVFGALLARKLESTLGKPITHWNLGKNGASSDYMSRVLISALPVLKPDIVVLIFPHASRREHIHDTGRSFNFCPVHDKRARLLKGLPVGHRDPLNAEIWKAHDCLSGTDSDAINLYTNYQVCASLCRAAQAMWLFSSMRTTHLQPIANLVHSDHWVKPGLGELAAACKEGDGMRLARDMAHPGMGPHRDFAALAFSKLEALYPDLN
jgi:hypothetical protein